jgi:flagellar hook-associated protein 2
MDTETTQTLLSGQINFSGLGSGTDFASMVDKLVQLERRHILRLEAWKAEWEEKKTGFQDLNTKLLNLRTNLQNMNTMSKFLVKTADSIDETVLTATANDKAQVGTHAIEVNQLAQTHILTGAIGVAKSTDDITGGSARTFVYKYPDSATSDITLNLPAGTTLEGLRNLINTDPDNPGVRASIIKVEDGDYRLQLRGLDLGQDNMVTVVSSDIPGIGPADFATTQTAQNSQIRIDGFPSSGWIERSTNTISDLVEGVTINLRSAGATTLNIAVNEEAVKDNVREFVNQVNEVRSKIKELTQVVGESSGSILTGNYGIQMIDSRLKSLLAVKGVGFDVNNDVFSALGMVGITTDAERGSPTFGLLKLDEEALDHALKNRPDELAQIFAADYIGSSNSADFRFYNSVDGLTKAGEYAVKYTVSGGRVTSATINGSPAELSDVDEITGRYGNPEAGLAIKIDNLTDGVYEGKVFLKIGKATELAEALKDLTDKSTGPLSILEDNYGDITDGIDRKIEFEERRVERHEKDLRNRFARLEALLSYYDSLGKSINSQLTQLKADTN